MFFIIGRDPRQSDGAKVSLGPILRPMRRRIVHCIPARSQLNHNLQTSRTLRNSLSNFVEQKIGRLSGRGTGIQILIAGLGPHRETAETSAAVLGSEFEPECPMISV
jgi:hypothetical protein